MSDRHKIRHLLDKLECDAVVVVALRSPSEEDPSMRKQSIMGVAREEDDLSANLVQPLSARIARILNEAFQSAGVVTDFVDRSTEGGNGEGDSGIEIIR